MNSEAPRILICRLSAIGDCILTLPVVCALRERFPKAFIAWVVEPVSGKLLTGHPCIDEIIPTERLWWKSPRRAVALVRRLRAARFDVTIDAQGLTKSSLPARLSGAPLRIGYAKPYGREASLWLNNRHVQTEWTHVIDRNLELLRPLGIVNPPVRYRLPLRPEAEAKMDAWLAATGIEPGHVIINVGAGWGSKVWPPENYAATARHLVQRHGRQCVVVWAGEGERVAAETICLLAGAGTVSAPPTNLFELSAITRGASLFVGSDTGPLHLAVALGVPCVGLYGPTQPEICGPYGPEHVALRAVGGGWQSIRSATSDAMQALTPEMACGGCDEVIARNQPSRRSA